MAVDLNRKANTATTNNKTDVDGLLVTKARTSYVDMALSTQQNTLPFVDPMSLGTRVAGYLLLIGSNIFPGLTVKSPLTLTRNANNYLSIGLSTSIFSNISAGSITATGSLTGGSIFNIRVYISSSSCSYR